MFDGAPDTELIDAMAEAARAESVAVARRLLAVGRLYQRRARELAECEFWCTDAFEATAAEVSAVQNISRPRAGAQIRTGRALCERLPAVAEVFATGEIDFRMVSMIIARTANVDDAVMAKLDAALAEKVVRWMRLSRPKLRDRLDVWVAKFDPDGVRVPPQVDEDRYVEIEPTEAGMAGVWGNIHAEDGAALDARLDALAATVCPNDSRTKAQRRADAIGAVAFGAERLSCKCGAEDCPGATTRAPAGSVVIHVLAEESTLIGKGAALAYLRGFGTLPARSARDLAASATVKPLTVPAGPEPRYRPSTALAEFVRWRDLTCRWPGCETPAEVSDIDHTVPYPVGPTHPSNNKIYCRAHHLIKTFYTGPNGWSDQQLPDGTIVFTAPTGHVYRTEPFGAALFPTLAVHTGDLPSVGSDDAPAPGRRMAMPLRKHTREQDRRARIATERHRRAEINAERERQHRAWLATHYEPPPF